MALWTARFDFSLTWRALLMTRDTVPVETPARCATSSRVGGRVFMAAPYQCCKRSQPTSGDHVRVPPGAVLRGAALGVVVDVHQAEPLGVAEGPLEVVEQRPGEVALQRHA